MNTTLIPCLLLTVFGSWLAMPFLSSAQAWRDASAPSLEATVLELAKIRRLQLAYAPELLVHKPSGCTDIPVDTMAAFACILQGTGLEVEITAGDLYVIHASSARSSARAGVGSGTIEGAVTTAADGKPLSGAHIQITGIETGDASGPDGRYLIGNLPAGHYDLVVSMVGYEPKHIEKVHVQPGQTAEIDAGLVEATMPLEEVVITSRTQQSSGRLDLGPLSVGAQDIQIGRVSAGILVNARPQPVHGLQLSGVASMVRDSLSGVQISGIINTAKNPAQGVQLGGVLNLIDGSLEGVQIGGLANGLNDDLRGAQIAGLANRTTGSVEGAQSGGLLNLAAGSVRGAQLAGLANAAGPHLQGVQAAGVWNHAARLHGAQLSGGANVAKTGHGVQLAGVVNIARADFQGAQLSLVNVAGATRGVQIGLFNRAESLDGLPLGLVSYVRDFGLRYDVLADETGTVSTVLRSGNRRFANYLGVSARPNGVSSSAAAIVGFGITLVDGDRLHHSIDALYQATTRDREHAEQHIQLRALFGFKVFPHIDIVAGPTLNLLVDPDAATRLPIPWRVASTDRGRFSYTLWPGMALGLRLSTRG